MPAGLHETERHGPRNRKKWNRLFTVRIEISVRFSAQLKLKRRKVRR